MFKLAKYHREGKELGGAFRPTNIPLATSQSKRATFAALFYSENLRKKSIRVANLYGSKLLVHCIIIVYQNCILHLTPTRKHNKTIAEKKKKTQFIVKCKSNISAQPPTKINIPQRNNKGRQTKQRL